MGKGSSSDSEDTVVVRAVNEFFRKTGRFVSYAPWWCMSISTILTLLLSIKIPFTEMENNISDFTPYEARSRHELKIYREFFENRGEPKAIYAFCSGKTDRNMLGIQQLNHTVQALDKSSLDFYLRTPKGPKNFEQYCSGFCTLNEPVRHFYSGMQIADQYANESRHLDLGYPVTTVLGTKLFMDPNFFGVKISVQDENGPERVISVADSGAIINGERQAPNNIRELNLIVLQFRAEIGHEIAEEDLKAYEREIVDYFQDEFTSDFINVYVLTDSYVTSEIVRAGLSLLPFLVIGFSIMAVFSSITFSISGLVLKQMNAYKIVLAIMACVCPFMACGVTLGGMFFAGFRFGSILCVTPFLVLAIGVDDAYLMVNAWQRITTQRRKLRVTDLDSEVRHRIIEMLVDTGPSVAITTITNVLAFSIGALTPTPEIQLFSIGNALAVIVDFIFQLTIYAALMVVVGRYEVGREMERGEETTEKSDSRESLDSMETQTKKREETETMSKILEGYCQFISNKFVSSAVIGLLAVYWYLSIIGAMRIKAELSPDKLFLKDSTIVKVFAQRKEFIIPYYGACWILVGSPGDVSDPERKHRLHQLVEDFEALPGSVGRYSTKFWLRDYEDFLRQSEDLDMPEEYEDPDIAIEFTQNGSVTVPSVMKQKGNELKQFLEWPEFSFWKGFIQYDENHDRSSYNVTKFFLTSAFHGQQLVDWSNRAVLLDTWRELADTYADLNVSIYEEDAKFLDLISSIRPIAMQSAFFTFISMFLVALLFISHPPTLLVATFSILSTSVTACVFGGMSWWGADLDPILMSATVMSIGFSVDIPSHISYHYYQTGKDLVSVSARIERTVASVGFPILQASISTTLCVLSLFFVDLHMSQLFAKCMLLVVVIGMIHGLVVIPVIFNLIATVPRKMSYAVSRPPSQPVVVAVNQIG